MVDAKHGDGSFAFVDSIQDAVAAAAGAVNAGELISQLASDASGVLEHAAAFDGTNIYRGVMPPLQRLGWILFLVCSVMYTWAGVRDGDSLIVIGSVTFGLACVLFLVARPVAGGDSDAPGSETWP